MKISVKSTRLDNRILAVFATLAVVLSGLALPTPAVAAAVTPASAGVNSALVASLAAAPTCTASTCKTVTTGKKAAKGFPEVKTNGKVTARTRTGCALTICYFYAGSSQNATASTGGSANYYIDNTFLDSEGSTPQGTHTLKEMAVQSTTNSATSNIVEVGITQDLLVNGGTYHPKPFVFWWKLVGGVAVDQCYNGCGWVAYTGPNACSVTPGVTDLSSQVGTTHALGWVHQTTGTAGWWMTWDAKYCGYYPDSLWASSGTFPSAAKIQVFGEVTSNYNEPCTDMMDGWDGNSLTLPYVYNANDPSTIGSFSFNGGSPAADLTAGLYQDVPHGYSAMMYPGSVRTIAVGGKGATPIGTYPGNKQAC